MDDFTLKIKTMKEIEAKIFQLVPNDFLKAAITAGLTAGIKIIYASAETGAMPTDAATWLSVGKVAGGAAIAYLVKNFLTNSNDQFLKSEPKA